jgi:hypothetical protein
MKKRYGWLRARSATRLLEERKKWLIFSGLGRTAQSHSHGVGGAA